MDHGGWQSCDTTSSCIQEGFTFISQESVQKLGVMSFRSLAVQIIYNDSVHAYFYYWKSILHAGKIPKIRLTCTEQTHQVWNNNIFYRMLRNTAFCISILLYNIASEYIPSKDNYTRESPTACDSHRVLGIYTFGWSHHKIRYLNQSSRKGRPLGQEDCTPSW